LIGWQSRTWTACAIRGVFREVGVLPPCLQETAETQIHPAGTEGVEVQLRIERVLRVPGDPQVVVGEVGEQGRHPLARVATLALALGYGTTASGDYSTALGGDTTAESYAETAIGCYDTDYTPASTTNWISGDRLFVIGNGFIVPHDALVMQNNGDTTLNGQLTVTSSASASDTAVCRNGNTLSSCSSSRRYKEATGDLGLGLATVEGLRPVSFKWTGREERDVALIAEEVAALVPRLVTHNAAGQVEGVKYARVTAVLVNTVKEQQAEIQGQRQHSAQKEAQIAEQREHIARQEAQLAEKQGQISEQQKVIATLRGKITTVEAQQAQMAALRKELQGYRELAAEIADIKKQLQAQPLLAASLRH